MIAQHTQVTRLANEQVVVRPSTTDNLGSSLRVIFGDNLSISPDMLRMLQSLDHATAV